MPLQERSTSAADRNPVPVEIRRLSAELAPPNGGLSLRWSGGGEGFINAETLRRSCPCASCNEIRGDSSHSKPLSTGGSRLKVISAPLEESLRLDAIWPVGNYALGIRWGDGHETGIYTFPFLRTLESTPST